MATKLGWFAEYDEDATGYKWRPAIELAGAIILDLDIHFPTEAECDVWIKKEIIGKGMAV